MARKSILKKSEFYDPHHHRNVQQPINNLEAFISIIKCSIGAGMLGMPMAFSRVGWLVGLIYTALLGALITYTINVLLISIYKVCQRLRVPQLTYAEAMGHALLLGPPELRWLAPLASFLVDMGLALYHFAICSVYIVFMAGNIQAIASVYWGEIDERFYMVAMVAPLLLIFLVRDIKHLVPFSAVANLCLMFGTCIMFAELFCGLPPLSEMYAVKEISAFPMFYGTLLFAAESVGVIIAIESTMETPKDITGPTGIITIAMAVLMVLYALFGFFGYWHYAENVAGSVVFNLPHQSLVYKLTNILFGLGIFFSYALEGFVTIQVLWTKYIIVYCAEDKLVVEIAMRMAMVMSTVLFAVIVPNQVLFIALIGSGCLSLLGFIFPILMDLCLRYDEDYGPRRLYLYVDLCIIAGGIFGGAAGTLSALNQLRE